MFKIGFLLVLFSLNLSADAGLPIIMLLYPAFWIMLPFIILLEFYILKWKLQPLPDNSSKAILLGNLVSTFLGYPLSWLISLAYQFSAISFLSLFPNIQEFSQEYLLYFTATAWLPPMDNTHPWLFVFTLILGLIPAFYISVYSEYWIAKKILKSIKDTKKLKDIIYTINKYSYASFILITIVWYLLRVYF